MTRGTIEPAAALLILAIGAAPAPAQQSPPPADPGYCTFVGGTPAPLYLDRLRLDELVGEAPAYMTAVYRPGSRHLACSGGTADTVATGFAGAPELTLLPVNLHGELNDAYPRDANNGLRWAGRGASFGVNLGIRGRWGPLSAALAPWFSYQGNDAFDILEVERPGSSPFAWYWRPISIDWPQRFGEDDFWWSHPGDSYIRADAWGFALGFSTEALRWGPARRYPLLMSGTAPGFPHAFLGTSRPVDIYVGGLSLEAIWGHLEESDYFDGNADNDTRVLAGLVVALEPRPLPGLSLGFSRAYLETLPPGGWSLSEYLTRPYGNPLENPAAGEGPPDNELFSVFFRWVLPASGFEVYGEYARDDQWDGWTDDFVKEPDHSAAVTAGLQKLVTLGNGDGAKRLRIAAEIVDTNFPETQRTGRPEVIFYTHTGARQGYTHRGQLLGAHVGPSGDGQFIGIDLLDERWNGGVYFERVRFAKDVYYQALAPRYTYKGHDVELTAGLNGGVALDDLGLSVFGDIAYSGRYNRGFVGLLGLYNTTYETNLSLRIGASWTPESVRSGR